MPSPTHEEMMEVGVLNGWWSHWHEGGPYQRIVVKVSEYPTWAHLLSAGRVPDRWENGHQNTYVDLGIFDSVGQAKKNIKNGPLTVGEHWFRKRMLLIVVEE